MINTPGSNTLVIVDSDALIGLIHEDDELHERCLKVSAYLSLNSCATMVPYPIVLEAATTLAKDKTIRRPDLAKKLLQDYASIEEESNINLDVTDLVAKLYDPKTSKKNSPFDRYVFSFDSFYEKNGLTLIEDLVE